MKSPKPEGTPSRPRYRRRKKLARPNKAVRERLVALMSIESGPQDFVEFNKQATAEENPRGAAILIAANVELALDMALRTYLNSDRLNLVFGLNKALGSFANKTAMAYALGMFNDEMYANLELIRDIRNTFAHSQCPITFETPQVSDACDCLVPPVLLPPYVVGSESYDYTNDKGLRRYRMISNSVGHNLVWGARRLTIDAATFSPEAAAAIDPRYTVLTARYGALP